MNFNTKETLIGLQCLGLDLETGKSTEISVKELEDLTGIRQVSNGSRIIRRDCAKLRLNYLKFIVIVINNLTFHFLNLLRLFHIFIIHKNKKRITPKCYSL